MTLTQGQISRSNRKSDQCVHVWLCLLFIIYWYFFFSCKTTRRFVGHEKDVMSVAFSADNRQIVSASRDKTVKLWNTLGVCKYTVQVSINIFFIGQFSLILYLPSGHKSGSGKLSHEVYLSDVLQGWLVQAFNMYESGRVAEGKRVGLVIPCLHWGRGSIPFPAFTSILLQSP